MRRKEIKYRNIPTIHREFSSINDIVESCAQPSAVNASHWETTFSEDTPSRVQSWLGCSSYSEVERLVKYGWAEGIAKIDEKMTEIQVPAPTSVKRRKVRDRFGDEVDIHSVLAGNLDRAWTRTTRHPVSSIREVTLYIDISANAFVTAEQLFWRGAAGIIICDALENAGYSVKVVVYDYTIRPFDDFRYRDYSLLSTVVVKEAHQPLNKSALASTSALAGFFRKYIFASHLADEIKAAGGLGSSATWTPEPETQNEMVFNVGKVNSQADAQRFVNQVVGNLEQEFDR
jgi:hypothetical protein